jgi:hypothetical protein
MEYIKHSLTALGGFTPGPSAFLIVVLYGLAWAAVRPVASLPGHWFRFFSAVKTIRPNSSRPRSHPLQHRAYPLIFA